MSDKPLLALLQDCSKYSSEQLYYKIKELIDSKPLEIHETDIYNDSALVKAIILNDMKLVKLFVRRGININHKNLCNITPIMAAIVVNNILAIVYLISKKCNISIKDSAHKNVLHLAALYMRVEDLHILVSYIESQHDEEKCMSLDRFLSDIDVEGKTPIMIARDNNRIDIAYALTALSNNK